MLPQLKFSCRHLVGLTLVASFLFVYPCSAADETNSVDLALRQSQIADRYRQLETMLLKMAEYDASTNPRRAALLRQTLAQGKERQVNGKLDSLVKLFQREQLQKAVNGQVDVNVDLKALLDMLLSEDRPDRLKNEQARVRGYIKQLDRIIRQQKSIQGRTEGGADAKRLAENQGKVADKTQQLGDEIDEVEGTPPPGDGESKSEQSNSKKPSDGESAESESGEPADGESESKDGGDSKSGEKQDGERQDGDKTPGEKEPGEKEPGEKEPGEKEDGSEAEKADAEKQGESGESSESKPSEGESQEGQPSESKPSESKPSEGKPSEGKPSQGQPQPGQPGEQGEQSEQQQQAEQQQQQEQFPGRKRIAAAEDRMRQAQKDLEESKRDGAIEKQEEARQLLELAKAELEEILRQLREEEIERVLAMLEGRFRRMLEMELRIQDGTVRLSKTAASKRTRQFTVKAGKLSLDQRKVVLEVDKALTLLKEEGSSVAFPEAVSQMRIDMDNVARRLSEEKVGELTQAVEADIVTALEEMIAALQKAQQEAEERRKQPPPPGQGQGGGDPSNQPLVNKIAELKMIRALQMRVNTRTKRFAKMLTDFEDPVGQATDDDLSDSIRELSGRQQRIHKVTSDIILGKNQ